MLGRLFALQTSGNFIQNAVDKSGRIFGAEFLRYFNSFVDGDVPGYVSAEQQFKYGKPQDVQVDSGHAGN